MSDEATPQEGQTPQEAPRSEAPKHDDPQTTGRVLRDEVENPRKFLTGARPTPRYKLATATPFHPRTFVAPPPQVAYVPKTLQMWGNDQYGVCVTSEEFFAKDCHNPNILLPDGLAIDWARQHGWLNGAYLTEVMDAMLSGGPKAGSQQYNDGAYQAVDYSNEGALQAALAQGPVKIAMDHSALPSGAGNKQGWYALGSDRHYNSIDHCVGIAGYGPAKWLYEQLGEPLPSALRADQQGYLLFTWSTLGFVDHAWIMSTCAEAWIRIPTTVGVPPLPPEPGPGPNPPDPPTPPGPGGVMDVELAGAILGMIPVRLSGTATPVSHRHFRSDTLNVNWLALVRDISKLVSDLRANATASQLMADILAIAADLGLQFPE